MNLLVICMFFFLKSIQVLDHLKIELCFVIELCEFFIYFWLLIPYKLL